MSLTSFKRRVLKTHTIPASYTLPHSFVSILLVVTLTRMAAINSMSSRNFRLTTSFVCFVILIFGFFHLRSVGYSDLHSGSSAVDTHDAIAGTEEYVPIVYESPEAPAAPVAPQTPQTPKAPVAPITTDEDTYKSIAAEVATEEEVVASGPPLNSTAKASKVAVIIEDRKLNTLIPLILHFASVLGPSWDVILYTSPANAIYYGEMPALARWKHQVVIRALPEENMFKSHESVSAFLTKPWIWEALAPADHVFMFQADSIICGNSVRSVDDFLDYDFIGAPVREGLGRGYNGGLSIRSRKKFLSITVNYDWLEERHIWGTGDGYNYNYEDQWFAMRLSHMPEALLPDEAVARSFAVETIWAEDPVGYHQVSRWLNDHMDSVNMYCPEVSLCKGAAYA